MATEPSFSLLNSSLFGNHS